MVSNSGHVVEWVDDYLHGVLDQPQARELEQHCAQCKICATALDEARVRYEALRNLPPCEASGKLVQKTLEQVQNDRNLKGVAKRTGRWTLVVATAASILLLVSFHYYFANLRPTPLSLQIVAQNAWMQGSQASVRIRLTDTVKREPVTAVPVDVFLADQNQEIQLASYVMHQDGQSPTFKVPDWPDGDYTLRVVARPAGVKPEEILRSVALKRQWRVLVSPDKPVYQPGQTIHVRSLSLRKPDLKPVNNQPLIFKIRDPRGNVIFQQQSNTSEFGISSFSCPLAEEILLGAYEIECTVGETVTTRTVEVSRYVLPKFQIQVEVDQPFYMPGQTVEGSINARYFFGKPVANAEVLIEARADGFGGKAVAEVNAKTDEQGECTFQFALPDRLIGIPQENGAAAIRITTRVRDTALQEHTVAVRRVVAKSPIRITALPEGGRLVQNVENSVYVFTTYPDGRPAETDVTIVGTAQTLHTNSLGVARLNVTPAGNQLRWRIRAKDAAGLAATEQIVLDAGRASSDFLLRTDKATYRAGETMQVGIFGTGNEPVFIDLLKDGQTVLARMVDVDNGTGSLELDIPTDLFGTVEMVAYRFGDEGHAARRFRSSPLTSRCTWSRWRSINQIDAGHCFTTTRNKRSPAWDHWG